MVIQTEIYPGFGYQVQQTYTTVQDGYYSPNDRYAPVSGGTHMPTTPYITNTPVLKPSVGYGEHHKGWIDTNKSQQGWNSMATDHYSHGSNGHMQPYTNYETSKYTSGQSNHHGTANSGYGPYGAYHGAQAPMGGDRVESVPYEYSSSARPSTVNHNSNGLQNCYQGEWKIKKIDD